MKWLLCVGVGVMTLGLAVSPAQAIVNYLSIDWTGTTQLIQFKIMDGLTVVKQDAYLARATGWLDQTYDHAYTPGGMSLGQIFCADVFETAADGPAFEYDVAIYTEADGTTGWTTPPTGTDQWRDHGNLKTAAFLANKWGGPSLTYDQTIALNVAIWQAAYGDRFVLTGNGGMNPTQVAWFGTYVADYTAGREADQYMWYDNASDDGSDTHQDFISSVPEPNTILLLALGFLMTGILVARRH